MAMCRSGCTVTIPLADLRHDQQWAAGGPTDLANVTSP
jgi:hypothetical protein